MKTKIIIGIAVVGIISIIGITYVLLIEQNTWRGEGEKKRVLSSKKVETEVENIEAPNYVERSWEDEWVRGIISGEQELKGKNESERGHNTKQAVRARRNREEKRRISRRRRADRFHI